MPLGAWRFKSSPAHCGTGENLRFSPVGPSPLTRLPLAWWASTGGARAAERRPAWLQEPAAAIAIGPLSDDASERLLEVLGLPVAVRPRIAGAAVGNPLFVEQLAAIADDEGEVVTMPDSIRGVLHARLDRLDREERVLLERAAVVGRSFTLETVLELTRPDERDGVHAHLLALTRKKLLRLDPATPAEGFRFHHALIRDAAYDGLPKAARSPAGRGLAGGR